MAGAEPPGEPHGRRRNPGRRRRGVPDRRATDGIRVTAGAPLGESGETRGEHRRDGRRAIATYMRANPQTLVLLVICLVLGLGTFLAVVFGLLTAGSGQTTGEPSGAVLGLHVLAPSW